MPEPIQNIPLGLLALPPGAYLPYFNDAAGTPVRIPAAKPPASPKGQSQNQGQGFLPNLFGASPPSGYTPEDVQKILSNQAEYWQRFPITPMWNGGKGAGGILPGIANFGSGYLATSIPGQQQARAMENERIRSDASNRALGATSLEDMVAAFQGGTPAQQDAAVSIMMRQRLEEYQRRQAMQQFEELQARRRGAQQPAPQDQTQAQPEVQPPPQAASPSPVAARPIRTLPLTDEGEAMLGPGQANAAPTASAAPQAPPPNAAMDRMLPPEMRGSGTVPNLDYMLPPEMRGRGGLPPRPNLPNLDFMLPPEMRSGSAAPTPAPAATAMPLGQAINRPPARTQTPPPRPSYLAPEEVPNTLPGEDAVRGVGAGMASPQVRGWLGNEEQPDFVGTPLARGMAPPGAPPAQPPAQPARPSVPQPAQISQPQAPQSLQLDEGTIMDMVRSKLITPQEASVWMQTIRRNPGEIIQEQAAQQRGKALGEAQAGLPQSIQAAQSTIQKIDEIAANPQLHRIIGYSAYNPLGLLPYTPEQQGLVARIKQVQGRFFLQAFDALRGGGQITEKEGEKAQEAISRIMNMHQDYRSYRTALEDARREVWNLTNVARMRAGLPGVPYQPAPPAVGAIQDGYRFNGGNPADPASWQRVQ